VAGSKVKGGQVGETAEARSFYSKCPTVRKGNIAWNIREYNRSYIFNVLWIYMAWHIEGTRRKPRKTT
jgi:hypothetical protein